VRVLQIINGLGTGGAERSLAELIPRAAAHGIDVEVVCLFRRDEGVEAEVRASQLTPHVLEATRWRSRIAEVRSIVRDRDPDVVHTTIFEADLIGRLGAARLAPVLTSLVNTSYEPERLDDPNIRRSRLRLTQAADALSGRFLTDHFHAITQAVKTSAVERLRLPADRITVIPRGRDRRRLGEPTPERTAAARAELGIGSDTPVIVNVGRQEFQKGQIHLIQALAQMTSSDAVLIQAGRTGSATDQLHRAVADLGLDERVRFIGHHEHVPDLLCAADVFAFPSIYEGLGGALLEAMALDIPIVASDIPAIREILDDGECGLLVAPGDVPALARAVDRTLDDDRATEQRVTAARARFESDHDLERVTERMIDLYRRVAGETGSAR
jgi:glycosyltransferase involved in cell wall biosynthesis